MQLPMTDWTEIFRDCYWYTSGLIAWLWRSFKAYTLLKHKEIFVKQKFQLKVQIGKNFYSSFSAMIWVGRIFVSSHKFRTGIVGLGKTTAHFKFFKERSNKFSQLLKNLIHDQ